MVDFVVERSLNMSGNSALPLPNSQSRIVYNIYLKADAEELSRRHHLHIYLGLPRTSSFLRDNPMMDLLAPLKEASQESRYGPRSIDACRCHYAKV